MLFSTQPIRLPMPQQVRTIGILLSFLGACATARSQFTVISSPGNHRDIGPVLQRAVDDAEAGACLVLPEGVFMIGKTVIITKAISLKGQGTNKTILYRAETTPDSILAQKDWLSMIQFALRSTRSSGITVTGICFRSKKPMVVRGDGGSRAPSVGLSFIQCVGFRVERCRFEFFANAGISVVHHDTLARGLIRNNEFYYNAGAGLGYGVAVSGTNEGWVKDPKFGTANFIFIEDNLFDFHRHSVAAGGCGLYVFRYNTVLNNTAASGGHAIDTHEARRGGGNTFGTRAVEIYHNKLMNTTYTDGSPLVEGKRIEDLEVAGVAIRAGDAVVYENKVQGYRYAARLSNWFLENTIQTVYPIPSAPGYLSGLALGEEHRGSAGLAGEGDAFFWNNTNDPFGKRVSDSTAVFHNFHPDWWIEGRDYHLQAKPVYKAYPYPYPVAKEEQKKKKRR